MNKLWKNPEIRFNSGFQTAYKLLHFLNSLNTLEFS